MTQRRLVDSVVIVAVAAAVTSLVPHAPPLGFAQAVSPAGELGTLSDTDIRNLLIDRIDVRKQGVGMVVGLVGPSGRRIITYGGASKAPSRPLDGDTLFEIGSVTKLFTSLLLAEMVQKKEAALTDPVARYLPSTVRVPDRNGRVITLQDLSMHFSALPRMPTNFIQPNSSDPLKDYSVQRLYEFLKGYTLTRDIGERYEYSNLGAALLGHALARKAGLSYEAALRVRVLDPLRMASTRIDLTPDLQARSATGHNFALEPVAAQRTDAFVGAVALRSSANDFLTFLAANLGYLKSPLAPAMAAMLVPRKPTDEPDINTALGWFVAENAEVQVIWTGGGTNGFRAFAGYNPKTRVGVVVLSNAAGNGVFDIGMHLLDQRFALSKSPGVTKDVIEITLDPDILERYTGTYQLESFNLTVTREGSRLFVQPTDRARMEVFAETERDFFFKINPFRLTFEVAGDGKATRLVLRANGRDTPGRRID